MRQGAHCDCQEGTLHKRAAQQTSHHAQQAPENCHRRLGMWLSSGVRTVFQIRQVAPRWPIFATASVVDVAAVAGVASPAVAAATAAGAANTAAGGEAVARPPM